MSEEERREAALVKWWPYHPADYVFQGHVFDHDDVADAFRAGFEIGSADVKRLEAELADLRADHTCQCEECNRALVEQMALRETAQAEAAQLRQQLIDVTDADVPTQYTAAYQNERNYQSALEEIERLKGRNLELAAEALALRNLIESMPPTTIDYDSESPRCAFCGSQAWDENDPQPHHSNCKVRIWSETRVAVLLSTPRTAALARLVAAAKEWAAVKRWFNETDWTGDAPASPRKAADELLAAVDAWENDNAEPHP